eukprot:6578762-Prorocentrum_lima.AAC.1
MSAHFQSKLLSSHFKSGRCPMSGKSACKLAAGRMDEVADAAFRAYLMKVRAIAPNPPAPDVEL